MMEVQMERQRGLKTIRVGILLFMGVLMLAGCASMGSKSGEAPAGGALAENKDVPQYLDFGDVLIPKELSIDQGDSFILKTNGQTVGILSLKGRVERDSLISFFENNMVKDNWRLVSYFKANRTLMLFQKDTRWCMIDMSEGDFYTHVKIWVSPTVGDAPMETVK
jgi:hypothetical protein